MEGKTLTLLERDRDLVQVREGGCRSPDPIHIDTVFFWYPTLLF